MMTQTEGATHPEHPYQVITEHEEAGCFILVEVGGAPSAWMYAENPVEALR